MAGNSGGWKAKSGAGAKGRVFVSKAVAEASNYEQDLSVDDGLLDILSALSAQPGGQAKGATAEAPQLRASDLKWFSQRMNARAEKLQQQASMLRYGTGFSNGLSSSQREMADRWASMSGAERKRYDDLRQQASDASSLGSRATTLRLAREKETAVADKAKMAASWAAWGKK